MLISPDELEQRLSQLKKAVPGRGLARHPSLLRHVTELPPELQSSDLKSILAGEEIKQTISFPPQIHRGSHYVPKQALLFTSSGVIHLQASIWPEQEPTLSYLRTSGLIYLKVTLILLYGFLEIVAHGTASPTRLEVEFNTVAWDFLSGPIRNMLEANEERQRDLKDEIPLFQRREGALEKLPLKFFNGARIYGILPGEELEEMIFQSTVWEKKLVFFRKNIIANTLMLLTSNYMVIIQEELNITQGWIITYIPRKNILGINNQSTIGWDELIVDLNSAGQTTNIKIRLTNEVAQCWHKYWIQHGGQWHDLPIPTS
jgi:hypothetical protein